LRLAYTEFLRDEAVFDDLIYVLLLPEGTFAAYIEITHLLADIGLVDALRMVAGVTVVHEALPNKAAI